MNDVTKARTVVELFERQAEKTPKQTAVLLNEESISYESLNRKANQLARVLRKKGIGREDLVAVLAEKSIETIIAILAIIKAGAAYVPVDPAYPVERINYIIEDSHPKLIVKDGCEAKITLGAEVLELRKIDYEREESENPERINESGDLLYVIYTSGTTGVPKGVMLEHHGVVNLKAYFEKAFEVSEKDVVLQFANLTFDGSVFEMSMALLNGATLCVVPKEMKNDIEWFEEYLKKNEVSIMALPPQFYAQIKYDKARIVVTAGSESNKGIVEKALKSGARYINSYGPTEGTVCATHWEGIAGSVPNLIPIGKPITNTNLFILKKKRLCGIGMPGELCIAGAGLARGYLNKPELTADKFIDNPFGKGKLYRTGDLARWMPDGNIEFLGRIDDQVKIRGFRVELGEIESVIRESHGVKDTTVIVRSDESGEKEINAYIVSDEKVDINRLRKEMQKKLPDYMIPAGIMQIEKIPLTPNGKPDKKALPKIEKTASQENYIAPRTPLEKEVAEVFGEVLKTERVGITNSFYEIGGDSIKAIRVSSKLREKGYAVKVSDIMTQKTVENIAAYIAEHNGPVEEYSQEEVSGEVELMPIHDEFFGWKLENPNHFNQSTVLYGMYDATTVEKALHELYRHHDALRIVYDGNLRIMPYSEQQFLTTVEVSEQEKEAAEHFIEEEATKIQAGMNMAKEPLMKAGLFKSAYGDYLVIVIHHLAVDIVSWKILLEDFETAYNSIKEGREVKLPKKTASYQEWAKKLNEYGMSKAVRQAADYWKAVNIDVGEGQIAGDRNEKTAFHMKDIVIDEETTDKLRYESLQAFGCEVNDILLSALTKAVHEATRQSKVAITLEGHGREKLEEEIDVSRTVGWFTNTRPVVTEYAEDIKTLVIGTKETLRKVPDKGMGYGFVRREMNEVNTPDILFNYEGEFDEFDQSNKDGLSITGGLQIAEENMPGENIQLNGGITNHVLTFNMRYNAGKYSDEFADRLEKAFQRSLKEIVAYCASTTETVRTPSDYGYPEWDYSELKKVTELYPQERIDKIYPLTPMQEGMLYHKLLDENATSYVLQDIVEVEGEIAASVIKEAVTKTVEKYDVLRTRFIHRNLKQPMQIVLKDAEYEFHEMELPEDDREEIVKLGSEDVRRGFDLETESPVRVTLISAGDKTYMIWLFHHIIVDGWCISLIFGEFIKNCKLLNRGEEVKIKANETFSEYVKWIRSQDKEAGMEYYRSLLDDYDNVAEIKSLKENDSKDNSMRLKEFSIGKELYAEIDQYCKEHDITVNTVVEAAIGILLQKYTRSKDVVFGKVVSGRNAAIDGIETAVGLFINTIPVRVSAGNDASCEDVVKAVQRQSIASTSYHYMPLAEIQRASDVGDGLIKIALAFENYYVQEAESGEEESPKFKFVSAREEQSYDMGFSAYVSDTLGIKIEYRNRLYTSMEIDIILKRIESIIRQLVETPQKKISDMDILTEEERTTILPSFNDTDLAYDNSKTIIDLFKAQVQANPDQIAVNLEDDHLTYIELDQLSNRIARALISLGVQKGDLIGIMANRSVRTIAGILGIIKAGAAYVPIDAAYPKDRIEYMLADSAAKVLVQDSGTLPMEFHGDILRLDQMQEQDDSEIDVELKPNDLAYVIYTSGTTGKPKGVLLEHKGVINLCDYYRREMDVTCNDVMLQFANMAFDASVWEIFIALLSGARLCLVSRDIIDDTKQFKEYAEKNHVTIASFPPQYYIQLDDINFKVVLTAGSETNEDVIRKATKNGSYINGYGPTENTVCVTMWKIDHFDDSMTVSIGKPIQNVKVYIMDGMNLCGIGVPGELCVAGADLARGYLNRPELTAEKFIDNPFGEGKLYRSGDLARWMPDGNIDFMGRIDDQVKIRGFRIELGEIEETIRREEGIKDVAVTVSKDNADKRIFAYIVSDKKINIDELKEHIGSVLPDYMIPSGIMQIDKIPVTVNGKLNTKALPAIELNRESEYVAPSNKLQEYVLNVWRKVLDNSRIGVRANFFEAGGNSVNMLSIIGELREKNIQVKVKDIHNNPTVERLCNNVLEHQDFDRSLIMEEVVIEKHNNMISSISENTDDFKWDEYNCFYKPVSIVCQSFADDYFDIVTMNNCFYTLYGIREYFETIISDGEFDQAYNELFENVLQDKLKLKLELVNFTTAEEMHSMIKESIDKQYPVLIAMDSGYLYYSSEFKTRSHPHYMIIKGYDVKKQIYMILDNIQLEKGASTVFKDFVITFDMLYEAVVSYREHITVNGVSWMYVFKNLARRNEIDYSVSEALHDHIGLLTDMHNGTIPYNYLEENALRTLQQLSIILDDEISENSDFEYNRMAQTALGYLQDLSKGAPKNQRQTIVLDILSMFAGKFTSFANMKSSYFKTINCLLKKCQIDSKYIEELKQCEAKVMELWQPVKQTMFLFASQEDVDMQQIETMILEAKEQENIFRSKLIECGGLLDNNHVVDKEQLEARERGYYVENPKKAKIDFSRDSIRIELDPNEIYDLWQYDNNAPRIGKSVVSDNWEVSARISLNYATEENRFQDGIVLNLENGSKFLYGIVNENADMYKLEIHCPELNDNYKLYSHVVTANKGSVKIRIRKVADEIYFDFFDNLSHQWICAKSIIYKSKVESVAIETKSWVKTYHVALFKEIEFSW